MRIKSIALFLLPVLLTLAVNTAGAPDTSLCGPKSLQIVLQSRKVSGALEELCGLASYDPKKGVTMLGLHDAARAKNVPVAPVRIGLADLCRIKEKSIAFVDGNHFLVVCGCDRDKVMLEDPFRGSYSQPRRDFQKRWNGEALVFGNTARTMLASRKPIPAPKTKSPGIQFESMRHAFGTVDENSTLNHTFEFRNSGSDTLSVTVRSTCSCTAALLSEKRIPPGGAGRIRMEFKTENRLGPTSQSIHVRSNDPANPMLTLTMTAVIRGSVKVVPERLWIDNLPAGGEVTREILVVDSGDGSLAVEKVTVPGGMRAKTLPARKDKSGLRVIPVSLTITGDATAGGFEKTVSVRTNDSRRREIPVPVAGMTRAAVKAFPPRIFFGEVNPDSPAAREVTISGDNGRKTGSMRARISSPQVTVEMLPAGNGTGYKLVARLRELQPGNTIRDSVQVYLGESTIPALDIPLFAKVVEREVQSPKSKVQN
ncbi:MAG: DUF1573 domain-containing protein [Candidatus Latescibacterota bacterium]